MKFGFAKLGPTQMLLMLGLRTGASGSALAAIHIEGEVQANGAPLANSTVALWQASDGAPRQLAQTKAGSDGRFEIKSQETPGAAGVLYLVSGNPLGLRIAGGCTQSGRPDNRELGESPSGPDQPHAHHNAREPEHSWVADCRVRHDGSGELRGDGRWRSTGMYRFFHWRYVLP